MSANGLDQMKVDTANLYREEIYTDNHAATFRKMIPVTPSGDPDPAREAFFTAQTNIMSQMGMLPINAPLAAKTLEEAAAEFPEAIRKAVDALVEEAREYQRQEASKIVVPGAKSAGGLHLA